MLSEAATGRTKDSRRVCVSTSRLRFWKILGGSKQNKKERAATKDSVISPRAGIR